eukprot:66857_1
MAQHNHFIHIILVTYICVIASLCNTQLQSNEQRTPNIALIPNYEHLKQHHAINDINIHVINNHQIDISRTNIIYNCHELVLAQETIHEYFYGSKDLLSYLWNCNGENIFDNLLLLLCFAILSVVSLRKLYTERISSISFVIQLILVSNYSPIVDASTTNHTGQCTDRSLVGYGPTATVNIYGPYLENQWSTAGSNYGGQMEMGDGNFYDNYIAIHPMNGVDTYVTWKLNGEYKRFTAIVGPALTTNSGCIGNLDMAFIIYIDDVEIYRSPTFISNKKYASVDVNITGGNILKIETDEVTNHDCDHAIVANPKLYCKSGQSVLAKNNACFSATNYTTAYRFNAPFGGEIYGITLVHKSGGVTCGVGYAWTNWGCDVTAGWFHVQMIKEAGTNSQTYYPITTTNDVTGLTLYSTCSNGCNARSYKMTSYSNSDATIMLIDNSNPRSVSVNDVFSLQYGEGCCDVSTFDNSGVSCADVYFMYSYIDPTQSPTRYSSKSPTKQPSILVQTTLNNTFCTYYQKDAKPIHDHQIAQIKVGQHMEVRFYFIVNANCTTEFCNVLHIGDTNENTRLPAIFITSDRFHISMSNNIEGANPFFETTTYSAPKDNKEHLFHFIFNQTHKIVYIDNIEQVNFYGDFTNTNYQNVYPIYLSNPWYNTSNITIRDLCIYSNAEQPSHNPTVTPTNAPTIQTPTENPTDYPTNIPTPNPTTAPTTDPTLYPSKQPSIAPTNKTTTKPTGTPSNIPTKFPSSMPTRITTTLYSSLNPSPLPSNNPSSSPSIGPTNNPSISPSGHPSISPSTQTITPTKNPSKTPSYNPTFIPSTTPTKFPSKTPTESPSINPSTSPSAAPTSDT